MARIFVFGKDRFDPDHRFETSWLVSPCILFGIRALISLYAFTTLLFNIVYQCVNSSQGGCETVRDDFSFFTELTYWGVAFYFLFAALHTLTYALSRSGSSALLDRFPRPLQALHSLFHTTVTTFPFLVTAVFWALLYGPPGFPSVYSAWSNVSQHALNSVFALVEIVLPRTAPPPWIHVLWLLLILALYLALAYVTSATKGFYTYPFLDPAATGSLVAAYVFGIAAAIVVVFAVVWALVCARRYVTERKLGMDGKFARGGDRGGRRRLARQRDEGLEMGGK